MYQFVKHAHSGFRYIVLALLIYTVVASLIHLIRRKENIGSTHSVMFKVNVFAMHFQLLVGIFLFILSPKVQFNEFTMSSDLVRFYTIEHSLMMIIAVVLVTIGIIRFRKILEVSKKFRAVFMYNLIALLIVLAMIPWPFRNLSRLWI